MNLRARLAKIEKSLQSSATDDGWFPGCDDRVCKTPDSGCDIPPLPDDANRWEKSLWADLVLMDSSFEREPGSPEEADRAASEQRALEILEELDPN
jgi:hypothetical protein